MTAPVAFLPVPRPKITKSYDQRTVEQSFQSLERDLQQKFDRRGDLVLDPGAELVLTADGSAAQYGIGIDVSGYIRILNYADGSIGTFSVAWAQVDGAQQEITNLTTYVDAADATLQASINTNATTSATNGTAISTLQTEITAAREGEASLLANITDVRTAFASADAAEASARATLQANLEAADTTLQANIDAEESARVTADAAEASARSALQATLEAADSTLQANIDAEESARVTADTAEAASRTALEARVDLERSQEIVRKRNFEDGASGGWSRTVVAGGDTLYSNEMRLTTRDTAETPYIEGNFGGRQFKVSGRAWNGSFSYNLLAGLLCFDKNDSLLGFPTITARAALATWGAFEGVITAPANTVKIGPTLIVDGDSATVAASGLYASVSEINIVDVTEAETNAAAIITEQTARVSGDAAEATARTALQATLESADTTLQSNIDAEASARTTADATAATDRAAIRSEFATADTTLQANIDSEASTRATADTAEAAARTTAVATLNGQLGGSANLLPNSTFQEFAPAGGVGAPRGWSSANTGGTYTEWVSGSGTWVGWFLPNERDYVVYQSDATSGVIRDTRTGKVYVEPGKKYEYSAYTGAHRCEIQVIIEFYNSSDVYVGGEISSVTNNNELAGGTTLSAWKRHGGVYAAPAGSHYARLNFRKNGTSSGTDSYMFLTRPMLAEAQDDQTGFSPYVPSAQELSAYTGVLQRAFVDSNGDAIASVNLVAAASGGTPATIELLSGDGVSAVRIGGNTEIDGNLVVNGTIQTLGIVANGVTEVSSDSTDAAVALSDNTWTDVASVAVTVAAGETIKLEGSAYFEASYSGGASGSTNVACDYRLVRDSTVLRTQDATNYVALAGAPGSILSSGRGLALVLDTDLPGAGTYTYKLQANITLNGVGPSATTRDVSNRLLIVTRLKR